MTRFYPLYLTSSEVFQITVTVDDLRLSCKMPHNNQLPQPVITRLGCHSSTPGRQHKLNAYAFQQDAIVTFNGFQYAAYWFNNGPDDGDTLYLCVARRQLRLRSNGPPVVPNNKENEARAETDCDWEVLELRDYEQTVDDGHNTVSLGICPGDGTIHLAFDHHCDM